MYVFILLPSFFLSGQGDSIDDRAGVTGHFQLKGIKFLNINSRLKEKHFQKGVLYQIYFLRSIYQGQLSSNGSRQVPKFGCFLQGLEEI